MFASSAAVVFRRTIHPNNFPIRPSDDAQFSYRIAETFIEIHGASAVECGPFWHEHREQPDPRIGS
jgi:hypothetical protein